MGGVGNSIGFLFFITGDGVFGTNLGLDLELDSVDDDDVDVEPLFILDLLLLRRISGKKSVFETSLSL